MFIIVLMVGNIDDTYLLLLIAAGLAAKKYIDAGSLVPDDVMVSLIIGELHPLKESWLLDGKTTYIKGRHTRLGNIHVYTFCIFFLLKS